MHTHHTKPRSHAHPPHPTALARTPTTPNRARMHTHHTQPRSHAHPPHPTALARTPTTPNRARMHRLEECPRGAPLSPCRHVMGAVATGHLHHERERDGQADGGHGVVVRPNKVQGVVQHNLGVEVPGDGGQQRLQGHSSNCASGCGCLPMLCGCERLPGASHAHMVHSTSKGTDAFCGQTLRSPGRASTPRGHWETQSEHSAPQPRGP